MPQISIIVPVYKVEPYLRRCVESICAQTFTDFDLVLVDDGSPDNCPALCDEYAKKDKRIHVIHKKNGGLSDARNAGIDWCFANSSSEWFSFIDSDDWIHPEMLKSLYDAVTKKDVKLGVCNFVRTTGEIIEVSLRDVEPAVISAECFWKNVGAVEAVAWNKLYQKELFKSIRYPVGRINEDLFTTPELVCRAGKVAFIDCPLYFYYQNPEGIMRSKWNLHRLDDLDARYNLMKTLERYGYSDAWKAACLSYLYGFNECLNGMGKEYPFHHFCLSLRRIFAFLRFRKAAGITLNDEEWFYSVRSPFAVKFFRLCLLQDEKGGMELLKRIFSKITGRGSCS